MQNAQWVQDAKPGTMPWARAVRVASRLGRYPLAVWPLGPWLLLENLG